MRASTRALVDQWWRDVFALGEELWSRVTVLNPHGVLGDYEGWYVAWREGGVHVSAPSSAEAGEVASLADEPAVALQRVEFWQAFANQRGLDLVGPSTHSYLDRDLGPQDGVTDLTPVRLAPLREKVPHAEWEEAGMTGDPPVVFGVLQDGVPVAAAVLNEWRATPSDIGVLVAPSHRGRGLAAAVGAHAASYAVREHGLARWRAATTNVASTRTAERLGFEAYATQLAIRPAASGA